MRWWQVGIKSNTFLFCPLRLAHGSSYGTWKQKEAQYKERPPCSLLEELFFWIPGEGKMNSLSAPEHIRELLKMDLEIASVVPFQMTRIPGNNKIRMGVSPRPDSGGGRPRHARWCPFSWVSWAGSAHAALVRGRGPCDGPREDRPLPLWACLPFLPNLLSQGRVKSALETSSASWGVGSQAPNLNKEPISTPALNIRGQSPERPYFWKWLCPRAETCPSLWSRRGLTHLNEGD